MGADSLKWCKVCKLPSSEVLNAETHTNLEVLVCDNIGHRCDAVVRAD